MAQQQILTKKGIILKEIDTLTFLVKDILSEEEVTVTMSGKMRMNYIRLKVGQLIYFQMSPYDLTRGRVAYKRSLSLWKENLDLGIET